MLRFHRNPKKQCQERSYDWPFPSDIFREVLLRSRCVGSLLTSLEMMNTFHFLPVPFPIFFFIPLINGRLLRFQAGETGATVARMHVSQRELLAPSRSCSARDGQVALLQAVNGGATWHRSLKLYVQYHVKFFQVFLFFVAHSFFRRECPDGS